MMTPKKYLDWVTAQYSYVGDKVVARGMAKRYCRKMFDEYGWKTVRRALNDISCKSLPQFEALLKHFTK